MNEKETIGNHLIDAGRSLKSVITVSIICLIIEFLLLMATIIGSLKSDLKLEETQELNKGIYSIMAFLALAYVIFFLVTTYNGYNYIIKAGKKMNEN